MLKRSGLDIQSHREVALVIDPHAHIHREVAVLPTNSRSGYPAWRSRQPSLDPRRQRSIDILACTLDEKQARPGQIVHRAFEGKGKDSRESGSWMLELPS